MRARVVTYAGMYFAEVANRIEATVGDDPILRRFFRLTQQRARLIGVCQNGRGLQVILAKPGDIRKEIVCSASLNQLTGLTNEEQNYLSNLASKASQNARAYSASATAH